MITLLINGTTLDLTKDSYKETMGSVEETHITEAGTTIRTITRIGIYGLDVTYRGTEYEKKLLDSAVRQDYLEVTVWDETEGSQVTHRMYIDPSSYGASLIVENDAHRFYEFSFSLKDLEY